MSASPSRGHVPKDHWVRRRITLAAITLLKHVRPRKGSVLFLTPSICVKYGPDQHLSAALAMQFVANRTTLPVPKIYSAFERRGKTYIVMSLIQGEPLNRVWKRLSDQAKAHLLQQLKHYVDELRSLVPTESGHVESVDGGKLYDVRLAGGTQGFGPFSSVKDFHAYLRDGTSASEDQFSDVNTLIRWHETTDHPVCFTHGDLNSMNILVRNNEVVGIVDWDTAGWFPNYWEYTNAHYVHPLNQFWTNEIDKVLLSYPEAVHMEHTRRKYFGAI